ncbi:MAG: ABC transporter permease subunit [Candidatus Caldarchaeum sp.]|nr:ABC transporter permease subunit [Candidatus Caldarchaeum sp.]
MKRLLNLRTLRILLTHLSFIILLLLIIRSLTAAGYWSPFTLPLVEQIFLEFINLPSNTLLPKGFTHHLTYTLSSIAASVAVLLGVVFPFSFLLSIVRVFKQVLEPLILSLFAIPSIIYYPILLLLFGFGPEPKVLMGIIVGIPPVFIYTSTGVQLINPNYANLGFMYTRSFFKIFSKILIPSTLPVFLTGIRLGISYCVVGVIFAEMTAGGDGLGFLISWSTTTLRIPLMYACVLAVLLVSAAFYLATYMVEKMVVGGRWR